MAIRYVRKKLVIVGDDGCGKTCIFFAFAGEKFPETYIPTVFWGYVGDLYVDDKIMEIAFWDTAGQDDYDRLRPLSYPDSDIVILCYAIDSPDSLKNVTEKWIHEIRQYLPKTPIILVGNKIDLRELENPNIQDSSPQKQEQKQLITFEEGKTAADQIGAFAFLECSAKSGKNINAVYAKLGQATWPKKKIGCCNVS